MTEHFFRGSWWHLRQVDLASLAQRQAAVERLMAAQQQFLQELQLSGFDFLVVVGAFRILLLPWAAAMHAHVAGRPLNVMRQQHAWEARGISGGLWEGVVSGSVSTVLALSKSGAGLWVARRLSGRAAAAMFLDPGESSVSSTFRDARTCVNIRPTWQSRHGTHSRFQASLVSSTKAAGSRSGWREGQRAAPHCSPPPPQPPQRHRCGAFAGPLAALGRQRRRWRGQRAHRRRGSGRSRAAGARGLRGSPRPFAVRRATRAVRAELPRARPLCTSRRARLRA